MDLQIYGYTYTTSTLCVYFTHVVKITHEKHAHLDTSITAPWTRMEK